MQATKFYSRSQLVTHTSIERTKSRHTPEPVSRPHDLAVKDSAVETLREFVREFLWFLRDEIVHATIDTIRVAAYIRSEIAYETRDAVRPAAAQLSETIDGNNLARDFVSFFAEGARVLVRR